MAVSIRLSEDIETRLATLATKTGRTKSYYIREAIQEHLDELEDYYLAVERLENPEGEPVDISEVAERLGLDDPD